MSNMGWTKNQEKAINETGINILVSAGAGSGKTGVLTERVCQLIKKGVPINRFLIVTFTNAAAAEMKTRIRKRLLEIPETQKIAFDIDNAHIETFDSFAMFLVKKYAFELNISHNFNILDNALNVIKTKKIIDEVFLSHAENNDPEFVDLVNEYCIKDINNLSLLLTNLVSKMNNAIDKDAYLNGFEDYYFSDEFIVGAIKERLDLIKKEVAALKAKCYDLECGEDAGNLISFFDEFSKFNDYDQMMVYMLNTSLPKKIGNVKEDKELRDLIKEQYNKLTTNFGTTAEIKSNIIEKRKFVLKIISLAKEIDQMLMEYKCKLNCFTFGDVSRFALKILENENLRQEILNSFDHIMVDEYQDTSDVQEAIVKALDNDNVYMVGDVKQSIYSFRNANCEIFQEKYNKYKKHINGETIELSDSFRSYKQMVDDVNEIFVKLFDIDSNPIDYSSGHALISGNDKLNNSTVENQQYGIKIYPYTSSGTPYEDEAKIIVNDIAKKLNSKYQVYEKNLGLRKCEPKDFAIIIQASSSFDIYRRIFNEKGIPINVIQDETLSDSDVGYVIKNLFALFHNIKSEVYDEDFVHSYASVSRSFLLNINDQKLYDLLTKNAFFDSDLFLRMKSLVDQFGESSLGNIFIHLMEEFDVYKKLSSIGGFSDNSSLIGNLYSQISQMDSLGFRLEDVINYFDDLQNAGEELKSKNNDLTRNAVVLMTIHGSKGLEYPICYFPEFRREFYRPEKSTSFIISDKYGILLPNVGVNKNDSLLLSLFKRRYDEHDYEEKLRLLYVALTRPIGEAIIPMDFDKTTTITNIKSAKNFQQILHFYDFDQRFVCSYDSTPEELNDKESEVEDLTVEINKINVESNLIVRKKASKENVDNEALEDVLEFGTRLHYLLEIVDYETKDLSFVNDKMMKKYINNVLNSGLFDNINETKLLHEFEFYDEKNQVNGVIDALLIKDDEIDIIDFKLKKIDDENYDKQLRVYYDYISQISKGKLIKMFLVSAVTGEVREVGK